MMHVAKGNLAGQGYNAHAVGRNPGLWTAEHAIIKNAVMQAELESGTTSDVARSWCRNLTWLPR